MSRLHTRSHKTIWLHSGFVVGCINETEDLSSDYKHSAIDDVSESNLSQNSIVAYSRNYRNLPFDIWTHQSAGTVFLSHLAKGGAYVFHLDSPKHFQQVQKLMRKYQELPMDLVDVSLVILAEELGTDEFFL